MVDAHAPEPLRSICAQLRRADGALGHAAKELLPDHTFPHGNRATALIPALCAVCLLLEPTFDYPESGSGWVSCALRVALLFLRSPRRDVAHLAASSTSCPHGAKEAGIHAWLQEVRSLASRMLQVLVDRCSHMRESHGGSPYGSTCRSGTLRYMLLKANYDVACSFAAYAAWTSGVQEAVESCGSGCIISRWAFAFAHLRSQMPAWYEQRARPSQELYGCRPHPHAATDRHDCRNDQHHAPPLPQWALSPAIPCAAHKRFISEWETVNILQTLDAQIVTLSRLLMGAASGPSHQCAFVSDAPQMRSDYSAVGAMHWLTSLLPRAAALGCSAREAASPPSAEQLLLPSMRTMRGPAWATALHMAAIEIAHWRPLAPGQHAYRGRQQQQLFKLPSRVPQYHLESREDRLGSAPQMPSKGLKGPVVGEMPCAAENKDAFEWGEEGDIDFELTPISESAQKPTSRLGPAEKVADMEQAAQDAILCAACFAHMKSIVALSDAVARAPATFGDLAAFSTPERSKSDIFSGAFAASGVSHPDEADGQPLKREFPGLLTEDSNKRLRIDGSVSGEIESPVYRAHGRTMGTTSASEAMDDLMELEACAELFSASSNFRHSGIDLFYDVAQTTGGAFSQFLVHEARVIAQQQLERSLEASAAGHANSASCSQPLNQAGSPGLPLVGVDVSGILYHVAAHCAVFNMQNQPSEAERTAISAAADGHVDMSSPDITVRDDRVSTSKLVVQGADEAIKPAKDEAHGPRGVRMGRGSERNVIIDASLLPIAALRLRCLQKELMMTWGMESSLTVWPARGAWGEYWSRTIARCDKAASTHNGHSGHSRTHPSKRLLEDGALFFLDSRSSLFAVLPPTESSRAVHAVRTELQGYGETTFSSTRTALSPFLQAGEKAATAKEVARQSRLLSQGSRSASSHAEYIEIERRAVDCCRAAEVAAESLCAKATLVRHACAMSFTSTQKLVDLLVVGLHGGGKPLPLSLLLNLSVYCRTRLESSLASAIRQELNPKRIPVDERAAHQRGQHVHSSSHHTRAPLCSLLESYARLLLTMPQTLGKLVHKLSESEGLSCSRQWAALFDLLTYRLRWLLTRPGFERHGWGLLKIAAGVLERTRCHEAHGAAEALMSMLVSTAASGHCLVVAVHPIGILVKAAHRHGQPPAKLASAHRTCAFLQPIAIALLSTDRRLKALHPPGCTARDSLDHIGRSASEMAHFCIRVAEANAADASGDGCLWDLVDGQASIRALRDFLFSRTDALPPQQHLPAALGLSRTLGLHCQLTRALIEEVESRVFSGADAEGSPTLSAVRLLASTRTRLSALLHRTDGASLTGFPPQQLGAVAAAAVDFTLSDSDPTHLERRVNALAEVALFGEESGWSELSGHVGSSTNTVSPSVPSAVSAPPPTRVGSDSGFDMCLLKLEHVVLSLVFRLPSSHGNAGGNNRSHADDEKRSTDAAQAYTALVALGQLLLRSPAIARHVRAFLEIPFPPPPISMATKESTRMRAGSGSIVWPWIRNADGLGAFWMYDDERAARVASMYSQPLDASDLDSDGDRGMGDGGNKSGSRRGSGHCSLRARVYSCVTLRLLPALDVVLERLIDVASPGVNADDNAASAAIGTGNKGNGRSGEVNLGERSVNKQAKAGCGSKDGSTERKSCGVAAALLNNLLRAYRPLYAHHLSRSALVLSLLSLMKAHPHEMPPSTSLRVLALACPPEAKFLASAAASPPSMRVRSASIARNPAGQHAHVEAKPEVSGEEAASAYSHLGAPKLPPPRRRGALWGCTVAFSRYAAPTFTEEEEAMHLLWCDKAAWEEDAVDRNGWVETGEEAAAAFEDAFRKAILRGGFSAQRALAPAGWSSDKCLVYVYSCELLHRTLCRLAAAQGGAPVGVPEVAFELPSEAQRALMTARIELAAVPVPGSQLGAAIAAAAIRHSTCTAAGAAARLAAQGQGGEAQAAGLLAGWLVAHSQPAVRAAGLAEATRELVEALAPPNLPNISGGEGAQKAGHAPMLTNSEVPRPSALSSGALFFLDGLWRASSPLTAAYDANDLVNTLMAAAKRGGANSETQAGRVAPTSPTVPQSFASLAASVSPPTSPNPLSPQSTMASVAGHRTRLALDWSTMASAPVLQRLAATVAAPLAKSGSQFSTNTCKGYATAAKVAQEKLIGTLEQLGNEVPTASASLENLVAHVSSL